MFSRFQRFYTSIKVAADAVMLTAAFSLAYVTRFEGPIPVLYGLPPADETLLSLATVLLVFPLTYRQARLYATNRARTHIGELFEVFKATVMATLILVALTYFTRERYSRLMLLFFSGYALVGVSAVRLVLRAVLNEVRRRGYNLKSILVIGAGDLGQRVHRDGGGAQGAGLPRDGHAHAAAREGGPVRSRRAGGGPREGRGPGARRHARGPGHHRPAPGGPVRRQAAHGAARAAHRGREGCPRPLPVRHPLRWARGVRRPAHHQPAGRPHDGLEHGGQARLRRALRPGGARW